MPAALAGVIPSPELSTEAHRRSERRAISSAIGWLSLKNGIQQGVSFCG